ncbi:MAG: aspartate:alanine exchanger family transporter [Rikenellaceae bacterium]
MFDGLFSSAYFALFVIVALGFILGRVNFRGISLDVSAVIFVALLFGHFGVVIPSALSEFGMVLFIFTIGMQAGPGFFDSFRSKGKSLVILAIVIIAAAAITAVATKFIFGFNVMDTVGLLTGALTSTPGLASAKELAGDGSAVSYGIAYPFGVIGVILFIKLLPKILNQKVKDVEQEIENRAKEQFPTVHSKVFKVTNTNIFNRSLADLKVRVMTGAVVSRIMNDKGLFTPTAKSLLQEGDLVKAVGTEEALDKMKMFIGEVCDRDLPLSADLDIVTGLVTNKSIVNATIQSINLQQTYGCTITRVRRSSLDLTPTPDLTLKMGDKLTIVGEKDNLKGALNVLGNDAKRLSDTDLLPVALGVVIGVLFGKISLDFGGSMSFSFGLTGGILLIALSLSAIGKTGPIVWTMSGSANQLLRQLGLILFLAGVGTSAGKTVVATFLESGWSLFIAGFLITLIPMIVAAIVGKYVLKINILDLMGAITGGMTSTPGLAAADSMTDTTAPSVAYATVYPVAMVFLILAVQLIAIVF